ncbi:MAG: hypothetical protein ACODAQ_10780, partial [Phycisphaeraceae bacterium]
MDVVMLYAATATANSQPPPITIVGTACACLYMASHIGRNSTAIIIIEEIPTVNCHRLTINGHP